MYIMIIRRPPTRTPRRPAWSTAPPCLFMCRFCLKVSENKLWYIAALMQMNDYMYIAALVNCVLTCPKINYGISDFCKHQGM